MSDNQPAVETCGAQPQATTDVALPWRLFWASVAGLIGSGLVAGAFFISAVGLAIGAGFRDRGGETFTAISVVVAVLMATFAVWLVDTWLHGIKAGWRLDGGQQDWDPPHAT